MKKRKRSSPIPPLRKGASDEEIIGWTTTHDVFDRLDAGVSEVVEDRSDLDQLLQEAVVQGNTAQLNMRIPPAMKALLSRLARQRTTDATTLARIWLAERLRQELKAQ
ncbi:MAG: hypothetical protein AB1671_00535 [Thermodesulfobacteriota bacterium]|jgi:hypothetical protein